MRGLVGGGGGKLSSKENNTNRYAADSSQKERLLCIDYWQLTHSIRLTNEAIIDPEWGGWPAQDWPLSGSSPPLVMLKMPPSLFVT